MFQFGWAVSKVSRVIGSSTLPFAHLELINESYRIVSIPTRMRIQWTHFVLVRSGIESPSLVHPWCCYPVGRVRGNEWQLFRFQDYWRHWSWWYLPHLQWWMGMGIVRWCQRMIVWIHQGWPMPNQHSNYRSSESVLAEQVASVSLAMQRLTVPAEQLKRVRLTA